MKARETRKKPAAPGRAPKRPATPAKPIHPEGDEHEGATEDQIGDLTGPGAGYDTDTEPDEA